MGIGFAAGVKAGYEYKPFGQVSRTIDGNGNLALHIDRDGRLLQRDCNVFGRPVYEKTVDAEGKPRYQRLVL